MSLQFVAFASEGFENIDTIVVCAAAAERHVYKYMCVIEKTPTDHHQVPRLCRKSTRGPENADT